MRTNPKILKDMMFDSTTQLVGFLQKHFVFKYDKETQHIFIVDKTNPERQRSREYEMVESKSGKFYLSEI